MMIPTHLVEHPEGGRFQEVFRSRKRVVSDDDQERAALTHIYFSLNADEVSRFHRVTADEIWNLYRGEGLILWIWDGTDRRPEAVTLSAVSQCFCHVVPAGAWQAAEPLSEEVLVGCSVAPGFEFEDFTLLQMTSPEAQRLLNSDPEMGRFVAP